MHCVKLLKNLTVKNRDKREIFFESVIYTMIVIFPHEGEPDDHCDLFNSENQDTTI